MKTKAGKDKSQQIFVQAKAAGDACFATYAGKDWLVVPVVALLEGVFHPANAENAELALAEEFGRFPEGWNGRPIVLNHPESDGGRISASHPDILDEVGMGHMFNARLDGEKLKVEAWLDKAGIEAKGGKAAEMLGKIEEAMENDDLDAAEIEVSVGFFGMIEAARGVYKGREYHAIWRDIVPDHLAFLEPGLRGACSVADGCGAPRLNMAHKDVSEGQRMSLMSERVPIEGTQQLCGSNGKCSCGGTCMGTKSNTAAALSGTELPDFNECAEGQVFLLLEGDSSSLYYRSPKGWAAMDPKQLETAALESREHGIMGLFKRLGSSMFSFRQAELSDRDTSKALQDGLREVGERWAYIIAVFDEYFVYMSDTEDGLFRRNFSITEEGKITLGAEVTKVRPVTEFVPVDVQTDDNPEERNMSENNDGNTSQGGNETSSNGNPSPQPVGSIDALLELAAPEVKRQLSEALETHTSYRAQLVKDLVECEGCDFDQAQLEGFNLAALQNMHKLAGKLKDKGSEQNNRNNSGNTNDGGNRADFSGRSGADVSETGQADTSKAPPAPRALEAKTA